MPTQKARTQEILSEHGPAVEQLQAELLSAESVDDFFGKDGIFARLFGQTLEKLMEAELSEHLGYERYQAQGHNSGNSRNGSRKRKLKTSGGETVVNVPRDRNATFQPEILERNRTLSNELEEKIVYLYAKGTSTRDIEATMRDLYGVHVSESLVSKVTDKIWPEVEAWQNRPLAAVYPLLYLDALFIKLRRDNQVDSIPVYVALGVDMEGHKDVLGHWVGNSTGESANFPSHGWTWWLSVLSDLQTRGVQDILIAAVDGLNGFSESIEALFPQTVVQRCIVHQIRHSLKYVTWTDRKAFTRDLRKVYQASTLERAAAALDELEQNWSESYAMAVKSWRANWAELSAFFDFPREIRRLMYTTNAIEAYNRQLRKVTKTKGALPSEKAVRKLLFLVSQNASAKWTTPMRTVQCGLHWVIGPKS